MTGILNISRWHAQWLSLVEKMDLHKFYSRQIYRKIVTMLRIKCEANAKFVSLFTTPYMFWYVNMDFTIFAPHLLFSFYFLFIYLFFFWARYSVQGENLCNKLGWARATPTLVSLRGLILIFRGASPLLLYGSPHPPGKSAR